jgi:hypothetical protein
MNMDQQKLIELLHQQNREIAECTTFCPDDEQIAAYFDGVLNHPESEQLDRHLIDCGYCLSRVAIQARVQLDNDVPLIPAAVLATADQFGHQARPRRLQYAPAWAVAATLVLTLFVLLGNDSFPPGSEDGQPATETPTSGDFKQLRNIDRRKVAPTLLSPIDGTLITPADMLISWTSVPDSLYYDIWLVDADGFTIWQERVEDTRWSLPDQLELIPGAEYFARVDAYLAEAKSVSSRHIKFTVQREH